MAKSKPPRKKSGQQPELLAAPEERSGAVRPDERPIIYPVPEVRMQFGDTPLTVDMAKALLGWEWLEDYQDSLLVQLPDLPQERLSELLERFKEGATLRDYSDRYVRCWNNRNNRPLDMAWCRQLAVDILNSGPGVSATERRWQLNLENIIIGQRGTVMSGQHRLIALVIAGQMWESDPTYRDQWQANWPTEPTLATTVACGAEETPQVFRTLDNSKPRTLYDVFATSPYFTLLPEARRRVACKALEQAVKALWDRTGAGTNPFVYLRTHGESLNFLGRHPRLMECVTHVMDCDKAGTMPTALGGLSYGTCAALLYLMGSADSDPERYQALLKKGEATEKALKWVSTWKRAKDFWKELGNPDSPLRAVLADHRCPVAGDPGMHAMSGLTFLAGTKLEQLGVLALAWQAYRHDTPVTLPVLLLEYMPDFDSHGTLQKICINQHYTVGGIDIGPAVSRAIMRANVASAAASDAEDPPADENVIGGDDSDEDNLDGDDEVNEQQTVYMNSVVLPDQAPVDPVELAERARQERLARGVAETREEELEIRARLDALQGISR